MCIGMFLEVNLAAVFKLRGRKEQLESEMEVLMYKVMRPHTKVLAVGTGQEWCACKAF